MSKPNRKTVRAAIRGSVPDGKLRKASIRLSDAPYGSQRVSGFTEYGTDRKTVVKIGAPDGDNATSITVRGHETRHATRHTKGRKKNRTEEAAAAEQIIDDVNIETGELPILRGNIETGDWQGNSLEIYRRAHLATAMLDAKAILKGKRMAEEIPALDSYQNRNQRLLVALRTKAILEHYRQDATNPRTVRQAVKGSRLIRDMVGNKTSQALHTIIKMAKQRNGRERAIAMLTALMETAPVGETDEPEEFEKRKGDEEILGQMPHGTELGGQMEIVDLRPKSVYTAKERRISMRYTPDGVHLNPARYVSAIVSGDANGMFSRRVRQKAGGTVVIDASGSMSATTYNLIALARQVPTATIAYYSGNDHGKGVLAIFAQNGQRYSGQLPENTLQGGNAVDLAAIEWMIKQPKPWTFVSDLGFTGGPLGSEVIAHALIERLKARGEVTHYASLDEAYEVYTKGGNLGEAEAKLMATGNEEFNEALRRASLKRKELNKQVASRLGT